MNLRDNDLLGRWGGDEFLLICPGTDQDGVKLLVDRLTNVVKNTEISGIGKVSISSGEATYQPGDNLGSIINRADQLMYQRKQAFKDNNQHVYEVLNLPPQEHSDEISINPARPDDSDIAVELIYQTFENTADYVFGLGERENALSVISQLFQEKNNNFSYEYTNLLILNGEVIGLLISYPGSKLKELSWPTFIQTVKIYSPIELLHFLYRAVQFIKFKEENKDEYVINNIIVESKYRGNGYGRMLLDHAEVKARENGIKKLSLTVEMNNLQAIQIYNWVGYSAEDEKKSKVDQQAGFQLAAQRMVKDVS